MSKNEFCCPYIEKINESREMFGAIKKEMVITKTDVEWLKRGYWLQTISSVTVLGVTISIMGLFLKYIVGI